MACLRQQQRRSQRPMMILRLSVALRRMTFVFVVVCARFGVGLLLLLLGEWTRVVLKV
jgi:hypothetical protein